MNAYIFNECNNKCSNNYYKFIDRYDKKTQAAEHLGNK